MRKLDRTMNTLNVSKKSLDSNIFIGIRYSAFIVASIVSALLNLFLFTSLDPSYVWLLAAMSLTLEGTKVSTIMMRNCFASLYEKCRKASIKAKEHIYTFFYVLLAILSITAGLGFSLTITAKTEASNSIVLETMRAEYTTLTEQLGKIENKKLEISELEKTSGQNIDTFDIYVLAQEKAQEAEQQYLQANTNYRTAISKRSGLQEGTQEYIDATTEINRANQLLLAATTARSLTKTEADRIKTNFNDFQNNSETVISRLNTDLTILNEELNLLISQCNLESEIGQVALLELDNKIREEENRHIIEKGMAFMFDQFSIYLHTTPNNVKLWILLFVAILIELTILQCSPDIKITRRVLYFFRNSIPPDADINELLKKFDDENTRFSDELLPVTKETEQEEKLEEILEEKYPLNNIKPEEIKEMKAEKARKKRKPYKNNSLGVELVAVENPKENEPTIEIKPKRKYTRKVKIQEVPQEDEEKKPKRKYTKRPKSIIEIENKQGDEKKELEKPVDIEKQLLTPPSADLSKNNGQPNQMYRFRFGQASNLIKDSLVSFIRETCSDEPGPFKQTPSEAAARINLNDRSKEVFLDKLSKVILDKKPVITSDGLNNWYSNFSVDKIIEYSTELI